MEFQQKDHFRIERRPLRMRGVFGATWQLYKRGFWPMLGITAVVMLPALLFMAFGMTSIFELIRVSMNNISGNGAEIASATLGLMGIYMWMMLLNVLYACLLTPMHTGAMYLEMGQRALGRRGTFSQLFKQALPAGLKRMYSTYWASMLLALGMGFVMQMVMTAGVFGSIGALMRERWLPFVVSIVLLAFVCSLATSTFMALIYPVVAHENKKAFSALGRALKLAARNFWRICGAQTIYVLVFSVVSLCISLPILIPWFRNIQYGRFNLTYEARLIAPMMVTMIVSGIFSLITMPYAPALNTTLYIDAIAREEARAKETAQPAQPAQPAQAYAPAPTQAPPIEAPPIQAPPVEAPEAQAPPIEEQETP
ncbi:hypothetical protein LJC07_01710 [Christensenellaceae bacterium OttesenSCG-928-L17]|nr:hypothetical protein [Christensenellaceae bacterium OttesenSCG-928-L17]